jgi:hypothetical protein
VQLARATASAGLVRIVISSVQRSFDDARQCRVRTVEDPRGGIQQVGAQDELIQSPATRGSHDQGKHAGFTGLADRGAYWAVDVHAHVRIAGHSLTVWGSLMAELVRQRC